MLFSRKLNKLAHLNNIAIEDVESHNHLGITLSSDVTWSKHISLMLDKAWKRIGLLRSLKYHLNRHCLEKMYMSFIRPPLEYGDIIWHNCTNQQNSDIESVQNEAARIVTGATKYCNVNSMLAELKWYSLTDRLRKHKLIALYKMNHSLSPKYLIDLLPTQQQTRYNLRTANNIPHITARTQLYHFFQQLYVSGTISLSPSEVFHLFHPSSNLLIQICQNLNQYSASNHVGLKSYTQDCSSLNFDLHRRSIADSPLCSCGSVETVDHILLHCPLLADIRLRFLSDMPCPPILQNLLFGNENLSTDQNKVIFSRVQDCIITSKRFG